MSLARDFVFWVLFNHVWQALVACIYCVEGKRDRTHWPKYNLGALLIVWRQCRFFFALCICNSVFASRVANWTVSKAWQKDEECCPLSIYLLATPEGPKHWPFPSPAKSLVAYWFQYCSQPCRLLANWTVNNDWDTEGLDILYQDILRLHWKLGHIGSEANPSSDDSQWVPILIKTTDIHCWQNWWSWLVL